MEKLSIAVPNGSLEKQAVSLLALAGICITRRGREFTVPVDHPFIGEAVFIRPQHMAREVAKGRYDLAICGLDFYQEYSNSCCRLHNECNNGRCISLGGFIGLRAERKPTKIVLFAAQDDPAQGVGDVSVEEPVLSEYPSLTGRWFANKRPMLWPDGPAEAFAAHASMMSGKIVPSLGSTEAHVPRDYRFGVCLTETGTTLIANNLKVLDVILETFPVLLSPACLAEAKIPTVESVVRLFRQAEIL